MYYTVIKHDGHLRTRGKCRKHEPQASVFYISRVFSNVRSVLSQCNTRLRLLHLLYDIEVMWRKTIKRAFSVLFAGLETVVRNFQYFTKRSWVQYWKFRVHCTVSKCVYLKTKHELTVSKPFNIQSEFTAGDRLTMASRPTCLNEKTMN